MKKLLVIIVLFFMAKPVTPMLEYLLNYDYIANELCENKEKPELKCNGKCHLMKQLAKTSRDENPLSSQKNQNSKHEIEVLFYKAAESISFQRYFVLKRNKINSDYQNFYSITTSNSIFRPPIFCI